MLRGELKSKEATLMKEKFGRSRAEAEQQALQSEVRGLQKTVSSGKEEACAVQADLVRLDSVIALAEQVTTSVSMLLHTGRA